MRPNFRPIILAALVGVTCAAQSQDLNAKVNFTCPAGPASRVLEGLSKAAGVRFTAGTQTKEDILCLRLHDATVQQVMDHIASVLNGEWKPSEGGFLLTRTGAAELRDKRDEIADRTVLIEAAIKKLTAEVVKTPKLTEEDAQKLADESRRAIENLTAGAKAGGGGASLARGALTFTNLGRMQPGGRAIARLLTAMNPSDLAALEPATRTVFSTQTTQMQRPMPGNASTIIAQFLDEQRMLDKVAGDAPVVEGGGGFIRAEIGGGRDRQRTTTGRPGKTLLVITRMGIADVLQCQLTVYDAQTGDNMASGFLSLVPEPPTVLPSPKSGPEENLPISALGKEFAKLVSANGGNSIGAARAMFAISTGDDGGDVTFLGSPSGGPPVALSKEWRERVLNPDKFEPLSTTTSDIFLGIANGRNENLVATFPDATLLPSARRIAQGELKASEALSLAHTSWQLATSEKDGWLEVWPSQPYTAAQERMNRVALGKMLRTLDTKGRLGLDDLATYAVSTDAVNTMAGVDYFYLRLLDPATADRQFASIFQGNREMLKFYGLLGQSQRNGLANGQPLALGSLGQKQRDLLHSMVYNSLDGPRITTPNERPSPRQGPGGPAAMMMGAGGLQRERTEALPTGVPSNGVLILRLMREQAVLATDSTGANGQYLTADALGRQRSMASMQFGDGSLAVPKYDHFKMADQTTYTFNFEFTRAASLVRRLSDTTVDPKSAAVAYEDLPREFRRRAEQSAGRVRAAVPGGGISIDAPPPR